MRLGQELRRLGRHSAIYGLGGLVSRILATLLLPLYTHYLPPSAYGRVEILTATIAVAAIALQMGIASAFFRFYFDAKDDASRLTVIRTSFWFTMAMSTLGLVVGVAFAGPIGHWLGLGHDPTLVRAGAVGLWAQANYQQLTALFRVEERSAQYAIASVANVLITVAAMVLFVAVFHWGAVGLVVGNFTGTLVTYVVLLVYRTEQLGLEFDRDLLRKMQVFGLPLVPSALALWTINWVVTGVGAAVNVGLNFWVIPRWGMVGASISTAAAYVVLFVGMTLYAQRVYPVPYQWRRIVTCVGAAVGLTVAARAADLPLAPSFLLVLVYPVALAALGFYLPAERQRLVRVLRAAVP